MTPPFVLVQLSDPHINLTPHTDTCLERAVSHLLELPFSLDAIIITGDLTDTGSAAEYMRCRDLLGALAAPVYTVPGNHDNREALLEAFGTQGENPLAGFAQYTVKDFPVRLIALDTHVPGEDGGHLDEGQLGWLEVRLAEAPGRPTLLFMHHPPFALGNTITDSIGLTNAASLADIVRKYPNIVRIVAGHTHTMSLQTFANALALTCPSIMHQMLIDVSQPERLAARLQPPACLVHVWREGTGLVSETCLIGERGPLRLLHDGTGWVS